MPLRSALLSRMPMETPPLDPNIADVAPAGPALTVYDEEHLITCMRVLAADQQGANWRDVSLIVLRIDPDRNADRARANQASRKYPLPYRRPATIILPPRPPKWPS